MATATKSNQVREVVKTESVPVFTLTLTAEEAGVLYRVCGNIGGDPFGPRGKMDAIGNALAIVAVPHVELTFEARQTALYIQP